MKNFDAGYWAVILGGSSGFGLATAKKLSRHGMNVLVVHRDRRGAMRRIEPHFEEIRSNGHQFVAMNLDALSVEGRGRIVESLRENLGEQGRVRLLMHSIAFGNLKPVAPPAPDSRVQTAIDKLSEKLGLSAETLADAVKELLAEGVSPLYTLQSAEYGNAIMEAEDMERTIFSMGTSLLFWVQDIHGAGLFADDARVIGMTSEGNEVAWKGYAAVAAAKVALESVSRAIAVEFAPFGIRSNIIQAGVTPTPALALIPGSAQMKAVAELRNPFGRTTLPEDVADFIALMCTDEAAWVNGAILRVDGGEAHRLALTGSGKNFMLYVHGAGHFHPENVIDNGFLESLDIDTSDRWIIDRIGIKTRRTVLPLDYIKTTRNAQPAMAAEAALYTNAQTGAAAAREALRVAGIAPDDIGLVIAGSCTPQSSCPAEACTIAAQLDIETQAMDINSACSSLAAQLYLLGKMKAEELPDYVLVVNPDNSTPGIDYTDRDTCVLWGDGSSALVVSPRIPAPMRVTRTVFTSQPNGFDKVQFIQHGHFRQEGRTVQTFAIKRTVSMIKTLRSGLDPAVSSRIKFIGHQANLLMLESVCKWADIDAAHHFYNVDDFGNCGAAGAPTVLSQNWHRFQPGDVLVLAVVGAGLSWGGMLIDVGPVAAS